MIKEVKVIAAETQLISQEMTSDLLEIACNEYSKKKAVQVYKKARRKSERIAEEFKFDDLIDMIAFKESGYEFAHETKVVEKLEKIVCDNNTAMRDSFYAGCNSLMKISSILAKLNMLND